MIKVPRESTERLPCVISANADPTSDTVTFAFVQGTTRPTSFIAGTWKPDSWDDRRATALTPTLPAAGSQAPLAVGVWRVFCKVTDNPDVPVMECDTITVT